MESIQFLNKVWIDKKRRKTETVLRVCSFLYLICDVILMMMEGIDFWPFMYGILAGMVFVVTTLERKNKGEYVEAECRVTFTVGTMGWEYPAIDFGDGKGKINVKYIVKNQDVLEASLSSALDSIRIVCRPFIEKKEWNGNTVDVDCKNGNQVCSLILYHYDIYQFKALYEKYMASKIEVLD